VVEGTTETDAGGEDMRNTADEYLLNLVRAQFAVEWTGTEWLVMGDDGTWIRVAELMDDMAVSEELVFA
jgi:hypothetical protein